MNPSRRRALVGWIYFLLGVAALAYAWRTSGEVDIDWSVWFFFTVAFVVLSFRSVEVNDRLYMSAAVMAIFTAGVMFELMGQDTVLALALMAAAGPFVPQDLRQRRIFQPAFNFGQMVLAATAAGVTLRALLDDRLGIPNVLLTVAIAGSAAALVYTAVNIFGVRLGARLVYGDRNLLPWSGMANLFVSQLLMGFLGGLLGAVLHRSSDSVLPLVLGLYVIGQLVFTSYARLREAHESTLRGFVKTLETRDLYTRGHTERVAYFCQVIGERLGFSGTQLERIRWAALIHDVGKLAVPVEVMKKRGRLDDEEYRKLRVATHRVDDLLSGVDFLRPMVDIASGCHPRLTGEDFGQSGHAHTSAPTLEQKVLAVADAFDAMTSTRSYRMAAAHAAALDVLREDPHPLYDPGVIEALGNGLAAAGERYGPPDLVDSGTVASRA